jgi:hypothetical protein
LPAGACRRRQRLESLQQRILRMSHTTRRRVYNSDGGCCCCCWDFSSYE